MKITVVPAQVTTVEDRILGSLSFSQMMLVVGPIFIGAGMFASLPPVMEGSPYKYIMIALLISMGSMLAIRIKGKIIALWLVVIVRYNLRPKYYLFNKNSYVNRRDYSVASQQLDEDEPAETESSVVSRLSLPETIKALAAISDSSSKVQFITTKKGGLHVRLTEIEE